MTPIPIPTDVATCIPCDRRLSVFAIYYDDDNLVVEAGCDLCDELGSGNEEAVIAWIIRKLTQPEEIL